MAARESAWISRELAQTKNALRSYFGTEFCEIAGKSTDDSHLISKVLKIIYLMAEREGFEPPIPFRVCRFSRPEPSTARPPLRNFPVLFDCTSNRACASNRLRVGAVGDRHIDSEVHLRRSGSLAMKKPNRHALLPFMAAATPEPRRQKPRPSDGRSVP